MMNLHYSNRLQILVDRLVDLLSRPLDDPLTAETILVPGFGVERWLSLQLARRLGICANISFLSPRAFTNSLFALTDDSRSDRFHHFDPATESWRLLPLLLKSPPFPAGMGDSEEDPHALLKTFQLSQRLAATFDKYLLHRLDLIQRWESFQEHPKETWQALLWRELFRTTGRMSPPAQRETLFKRLQQEGPDKLELPPRIFVFNINFLPLFHLQLLEQLGRYREIHFFLLNPASEYWLDISSETEISREIKKISEKIPGRIFERQELHLESGNSLLASLGKGGKFFHRSLMEAATIGDEQFEELRISGLLTQIQHDIFSLTDGSAPGAAKALRETDDHSLQIHSCHSPLRELEVLYDALLSLFERLEGLNPEDILILAPDIEEYAPLIEVVFSTPSFTEPASSRIRIPFTIAGRSALTTGSIGITLLKLLDLLEERMKASEVLEVLESEPIRKKMDLSPQELQTIRRWVRETRIHWGLDPQEKKELDLPPVPENTWQAGMDRLLLGYACAGNGESIFQGIVPYGEIEGEEASTLAKLLDFLHNLHGFVRESRVKKTLSSWSEFLLAVLGLCKADEEKEIEEMKSLSAEIHRLALLEKKNVFTGTIDFPTLKYYLGERLATPMAGGYFSGGVTFGELNQLSALPSRVIWLLGMNYDAFPGQSPRYGFDLTILNPSPGDPSRRDEERYHFLTSLISAGDCLVISYVGQSIQDNSPIPPSSVVSELLDYLEQGFQLPDGQERDSRQEITVRHPRHPYDKAYFSGDLPEPQGSRPLFSYSQENFQAASAFEVGRGEIRPFLSKSFFESPSELKIVTIEELVRFFRHPVRYFLQKRLGFYLEGDRNMVSDRENFELTGLDNYKLNQFLLDTIVHHGPKTPAHYRPLARAEGILPHGTPGDILYQERYQEIVDFVARLDEYRAGVPPDSLPIEFTASGYRVQGRLERISEKGQLLYDFGKTKGRNLLAAWVRHVIFSYCALPSGRRDVNFPKPSEDGGDETARTIYVTGEHLWEFSPPADPGEALGRLLYWHEKGLKGPIKLFGDFSWDFAEDVLVKNKPREDSLRKVRQKWSEEGSRQAAPEDLYIRQCFATTNPIDEEFADIALEIFEGILATTQGSGVKRQESE